MAAILPSYLAVSRETWRDEKASDIGCVWTFFKRRLNCIGDPKEKKKSELSKFLSSSLLFPIPMANKDNHSVIDWILQLDSPPSTTNSQPSPDTQQSTFSSLPSIPNDAGSTSVLTKSELFEFYLGDEVDQASKDVQHQQLQAHHAKRSAHHSDDDRHSITTSTTFTTTAKRTKKAKPTGAEPLSGRLDFRPTMTDQVPESQLKAMTPRERRQLRNKISARNFRNRRKGNETTHT